MPIYDYYAGGVGLDATTLTLFSTITGTPATMRPPGTRVPLQGPIAEMTLDGGVQNNGQKNAKLFMGGLLRSQLDALVAATVVTWETASADYTFVGRDERWNWGTWNAKVWLPRDLSDQEPDYELMAQGHAQNIYLPFKNCRRELLSVSGATTLTATQRYVKVDTSGGNVTVKLPAASAVDYVVFSIIKTAAANTLTIQRADAPGTDTVEGAASIAITALNEQSDLWIDTGTNWSRIA